MTDLKIEQRHRDAAADYMFVEGSANFKEMIDGGWDENSIVQAFAAFERDHLSPPQEGIEDRAREEAIAVLEKWQRDMPDYTGDQPKALHYQRQHRALATALAAISAYRQSSGVPAQGNENDLSRTDNRSGALCSLDNARLVLFQAIRNIQIGNPTDDKLILEELRKLGYWVATLTPVPIEAGEVEPEPRAWAWLEGKFGEPADRDYSADEMVDAFMAGRESATPSASSEVDRETVARLALLHMFGLEYKGDSLCDEADRIVSPGNPKAIRAVKLTDAILALLPPTGNSRGDDAERLRDDLKHAVDAQVASCEACSAPLFDGDDFVSDPNSVSGCWAAMTDAESRRERPCYAYRVGKPDANRPVKP